MSAFIFMHYVFICFLAGAFPLDSKGALSVCLFGL